jgi:hypothetical protein
MEAVYHPETIVPIYQTRRRFMTEYLNIRFARAVENSELERILRDKTNDVKGRRILERSSSKSNKWAIEAHYFIGQITSLLHSKPLRWTVGRAAFAAIPVCRESGSASFRARQQACVHRI